MLADGRLNVTAVGLLAPYLTAMNRDDLLARAAHRSKRRILELIAEIAPRPDVPAVMRKLPERKTVLPPAPVPGPPPSPQALVGLPDVQLRPDGVDDGSVASPPDPPPLELRPDGVETMPAANPAAAVTPALAGHFGVVQPRTVIEPLSPARYKIQFTAGARLHDLLERLRGLTRSTVPDGDLPPSSRSRSPRRWSGWKRGASGRRKRAGRWFRRSIQVRSIPIRPRATFRPRSSAW
jgi:hypothetical protein